MARPATAEWEVLDLSEDPTPGDPEILRKLATEYDAIADDAESTFTFVSRVDSGQTGEGKSMDKLREVLDDLPGQIGQVRDSYRLAADTLNAYIPKLETHQENADRALEDGRAAKERLGLAIAALETAESNVTSLESGQPPKGEQVQAAALDAIATARTEQTTAQGDVDSAETALSAAKRLAEDARALRESDASAAANEFDAAKDSAVEGYSFWEGLWDEILSLVLGIIAVVVAVVGILVPPLAVVSLVIGLVVGVADLALTIGKGIDTGDMDWASLALGIVGLGLGGFSGVAKVIDNGGGVVNTLKQGFDDAVDYLRPPKPGGGGSRGLDPDSPPPSRPVSPGPEDVPLPPSRPVSPGPEDVPVAAVASGFSGAGGCSVAAVASGFSGAGGCSVAAVASGFSGAGGCSTAAVASDLSRARGCSTATHQARHRRRVGRLRRNPDRPRRRRAHRREHSRRPGRRVGQGSHA